MQPADGGAPLRGGPDALAQGKSVRLAAHAQGKHVMTVCNACRYCEQFCAVFPAMERRRTFTAADLDYLANLCHNCGECLYACQFAPPHEYGINVPRTLEAIRLQSYEEYCWPRVLGVAFRRSSILTALTLAGVLTTVLFAAVAVANPDALTTAAVSGDFYAVVPHSTMVGLFGGVFLFVVVALAIALSRFWNDTWCDFTNHEKSHQVLFAIRDVLTLRNLHASGSNCVSSENAPSPWRRWFHHCTFYGFALCFASTTIAAIYHGFFGWQAPYGYTSLPVILGTLGGVGLLVGPLGQLMLRARRDPDLADPIRGGLDDAFIALLFLTSLTGLMLLALRREPIMAVLLIVHLGAVLALFLTLPYGKFVHGLYRAAALVKAAREGALESRTT
jgi:citrate/tricarballylate utilization protein